MTVTNETLPVVVRQDNALWRWFYDTYNGTDIPGSGMMREWSTQPLRSLREGFQSVITRYVAGWRPSSWRDAATEIEAACDDDLCRSRSVFVDWLALRLEDNSERVLSLLDEVSRQTPEAPVVPVDFVPAEVAPWDMSLTVGACYKADDPERRIVAYADLAAGSRTATLYMEARRGTSGVSIDEYVQVLPGDVLVLAYPCESSSGLEVGTEVEFLRPAGRELLYVESDHYPSAYTNGRNLRFVRSSRPAPVADPTIDVGGIEYVRKDIVDSDIQTLTSVFTRASKRENLCGVYDATVNMANRRMQYVRVGKRVASFQVEVVETYEVHRVITIEGTSGDEDARTRALRWVERRPLSVAGSDHHFDNLTEVTVSARSVHSTTEID